MSYASIFRPLMELNVFLSRKFYRIYFQEWTFTGLVRVCVVLILLFSLDDKFKKCLIETKEKPRLVQ